jgi:hypothetical protein
MDKENEKIKNRIKGLKDELTKHEKIVNETRKEFPNTASLTPMGLLLYTHHERQINHIKSEIHQLELGLLFP